MGMYATIVESGRSLPSSLYAMTKAKKSKGLERKFC